MRRTPLAWTLGLAFLTTTGGAFAAEGKAPAEPRRAPAPAAAPTPAPPAPAPTPTPAPADEPPPDSSPAPESAPDDSAPPPPGAESEGAAPEAEADGSLSELGRVSLLAPPPLDKGPTKVALATDTLGGHIMVGAAASLFVPFGSFQEDLPQSRLLDPGLGLRLDVAYGVSRTVMLGLYGELALPDGSSTWAGEKKAQSIAVGPLVRYHLVQGVRFDPWIAFGAGYRRTSGADETYTGIDFARIQIGGDYYGFSNMGIGPLVELAVGTYVAADGTTMGAGSVYGNFTLGARFTFDGPGK